MKDLYSKVLDFTVTTAAIYKELAESVKVETIEDLTVKEEYHGRKLAYGRIRDMLWNITWDEGENTFDLPSIKNFMHVSMCAFSEGIAELDAMPKSSSDIYKRSRLKGQIEAFFAVTILIRQEEAKQSKQ